MARWAGHPRQPRAELVEGVIPVNAQPSHNRAWSAAMVTTMLAVFTTVLASPADAAPPGATISLAPPFSETRDYSSCDGVEGTATCSVFGSGTAEGGLTASAYFAPTSTVATGRALGHGGLVTYHRLPRPVAAVRYTFHFLHVEAAASTGGVSDVRASLSGAVAHPGCSGCTATAERLLADSDSLTTDTPSQDRLSSFSLVIELRNPSGDLPPGVVTVMPLGSASVSPPTGASITFVDEALVYVSATASVDAQVLPA